MWPSKDKYILTIVGAFTNVSTSIINASNIVDFEGCLRDIEKFGFKIERPISVRLKEKESKSPEEFENEQKFLELEKSLIEEKTSNSEIKKPILKKREGK